MTFLQLSQLAVSIFPLLTAFISLTINRVNYQRPSTAATVNQRLIEVEANWTQLIQIGDALSFWLREQEIINGEKKWANK